MAQDALLNNRYRLLTQLASGGMAVVYRARDELLGREVAIKILRPSLTADPAFVARFQGEARNIANLQHRNIVTVHDVGNDGPTYYIVMELVQGRDLKKEIKAFGVLELSRALDLAIQLCEGIGFAHRAGIVHADIKPQNVLLTEYGEVKITDFGIAQALSDTQPAERQSVVWGSPHYFAPEQAQGERPTEASDVYSIGIVMFEMVTGRLPYAGSNQQELAMAHIKSEVPVAHEVNGRVPVELSEIIRKVMKKNPNDRFRHAGQLAAVLKQYRDRSGQHTLTGAPPVHMAPPADLPEMMSATPPPDSLPGTSQGSQPHVPATQPYSVAPEAPASAQIGRDRASIPRPVQPQSESMEVSHPRAFTRTPSRPGSSNPANPRYPYNQQLPHEEEPTFTLDAVTIALGVLALTSIACLFPLYYFALFG